MKILKLSLLLLVLVAIQSSYGQSKKKQNEKPNILVILSDDMGFSDLACYGGEINTPNLDALANKGLRFSQFYNTARCCPTRASLLTGLHPHQAGVGYMAGKIGESTAYQGFLRKDRRTIAEVMKQGGYTTLHVGKWHVGNEKTGTTPLQRGFERGWSPWSEVNYWDTEKIYEDGIIRERKPEEMGYLTDVTGDKAIEYIEYATKKETPFFMYLAFNAAHWPMHAKPEDIEKYRGKYIKGWDNLRLERIKRLEAIGMVSITDPEKIIEPNVPSWDDIPKGDTYPGYHDLHSGKHDQDDWDSKMAVYAAMVDCMDQNIGKVIEKLKKSGQYENTIIMFLQDNGACAEEVNWKETDYPGESNTYISYDLPWANLSNTPFRMYKHLLHEGGISTPFIVHWPAGMKEERKGAIEKESFGQIIDILPTCMEAAGIDDTGFNYSLEGQSLISVIQGAKDNSDRELFWEHEGNRSVRKGDWKLVSRYENDAMLFRNWNMAPRTQEWELYNIKEDRWEQNELSSQYPKIVEELKKDYTAYYKRVEAIPRKELIQGTNLKF